jgi:tRNA A37 threonylcarbamoyladenosine synthetase subunit TsaC/SUA5/YrdC
MPQIQAVMDALRKGLCVVLPRDIGYVLAVDLFQTESHAVLLGSPKEKIPAVLVADVDHLGALTDSLSTDAQVIIHRFLPGTVKIAVHPSSMVPATALMENGLVALGVPSQPVARNIIAEFGRPLLTVPCPEGPSDSRAAAVLDVGPLSQTVATVIDVTVRPARLLRVGVPERGTLERYILLEDNP